MSPPPDPLNLAGEEGRPHAPPPPATLRLTGVLLLAWFAASFGFAYFARELDFELFGWPFSFWMAAQGAPVVYVLITVVYAALARRHDEDPPPGG